MELLAKLFQQLLTMAVTALPIMAVVLVVRWVLSRAPKKYGYFLWVVVALRLLCPVMPESPIGIVSSIDTAKQVEVVADAYLEPTLTYTDNGGFTPDYDVLLNRGYTPNEKGDIVTNEAGTREAFQVRDLMPVAAVIWLIGVTVGMCYIVVSFWRLRRSVATAVCWQDNVWQCDNIPTPFVLGWFWPNIYIPFRMDEQEQAYVLAHEHYHIRRGDHWAKTLALVLLVVYWWNPTVWLCWVLFCRDMEMSCDEAVLAQLGSDVKQGYSMSLVSFALDRRFPAALAFGEHDAVRRVKHVLKWKQAKPVVAFLALAAVIIVVAVCGTNANSNGRVIATNIAEGYYREGIQIEYRMPRGIKSWAIYQDVYDDGKLVSSTPCVSDGFQEDGTGTTPRKGSMQVIVSPDAFEGDLIVGDLNCRYVGAQELEWKLQLPRKLYGNMTGDFGRAESRSHTWTLEPGGEILLYNIVLSEDGSITFADHPVGLTKRNDTVVQYWLATSTDEATAFADKPLDLAQTLYDLRVDTVENTDAVEELLEYLNIRTLGNYVISTFRSADDTVLQISFEAILDDQQEIKMWENTCLLLALVKDIDRVDYSFPTETGSSTMTIYSESDPLDNWVKKLGYESVKDAGRSAKGIRRLMDYIGWTRLAGVSVIGTWQAEVTVINAEILNDSVDTTGDNYFRMIFNEDLTGQEVVVVFGGVDDVSNFTYKIVDDEIHIETESGTLIKYPYRIEGDTLVLMQRGREMVFERVSGKDALTLVPDTDGGFPLFANQNQREWQRLVDTGIISGQSTLEMGPPTSISEEIVVNGVVPSVQFENGECIVFSYNTLGEGWLCEPGEQLVFDYRKATEQLFLIGYIKDGIMYDGVRVSEPEGTYVLDIAEEGKYLLYILNASSDPITLTGGDITNAKTHPVEQEPESLPTHIPTEDDIHKALMSQYAVLHDESEASYPYRTSAHHVWATRQEGNTANVYALVNYTTYDWDNGRQKRVSWWDGPAKLTFTWSNGWQLTDFWRWTEDEQYETAIQNQFPADVATVALGPMDSDISASMNIRTYEAAAAYYVTQSGLPDYQPFTPADVEFSGQTLYTSVDIMTYEERLAWAQAGEDNGNVWPACTGQYSEGEGCIAYVEKIVAGRYPDLSLWLRFADGTTSESLPLLRSSGYDTALPEVMEFRNGKFIYEITFPTEELTNEGQTLIHLKGTYHYEVDLTAKTLSLTVIQ